MKAIILENRSLAENDPMNLLKFRIALDLYNVIGESDFVDYVWKVLNENE